MYTFFTAVFFIGVLLIGAGLVGRIGTDEKFDIGKNVASAFALLVTYAFLLLSLSSFSELASFFRELCGGIPFVNEIADCGSLQKVWEMDPAAAVIEFFDVVILSALIEVIMLLPLGHNQNSKHFFTNVGNLMTNLFVATLSAIVGLLILNYVVKTSDVYKWITSTIGGIIAVISVGTVPMMITALRKKSTIAVGMVGAIMLFSRSRIVGIFRSAFLKAIVYVGGIWLLEKTFGTVANGMSHLASILIAAGPTIVMLIGIGFIVKSVMPKKK